MKIKLTTFFRYYKNYLIIKTFFYKGCKVLQATLLYKATFDILRRGRDVDKSVNDPITDIETTSPPRSPLSLSPSRSLYPCPVAIRKLSWKVACKTLNGSGPVASHQMSK